MWFVTAHPNVQKMLRWPRRVLLSFRISYIKTFVDVEPLWLSMMYRSVIFFCSDGCWGRRSGLQEVDTHYCYGSFSSGCCYIYNILQLQLQIQQLQLPELLLRKPFLSTIINISSEHFAMFARSHRVWNSLCRVLRIERTEEHDQKSKHDLSMTSTSKFLD